MAGPKPSRGYANKLILRIKKLFSDRFPAFKLVMGLIFSLILIDLAYIATIWPNWDKISEGEVPKSSFIEMYEKKHEQGIHKSKLRWKPQKQNLRKDQLKPFVLAEDSRFYQHSGIDLEAFIEAMKYNWRRGKIVLGASTISQQTVKNLLLSPSKTILRKWHELFFTIVMEAKLTKKQIIHVYVNIAEFGPGIYGIAAAANFYFGVSPSQLNRDQLIQLAASLPSPKKHNPSSQTRNFLARVERIRGYFINPPSAKEPAFVNQTKQITPQDEDDTTISGSWDFPIRQVEIEDFSAGEEEPYETSPDELDIRHLKEQSKVDEAGDAYMPSSSFVNDDLIQQEDGEEVDPTPYDSSSLSNAPDELAPSGQEGESYDGTEQ